MSNYGYEGIITFPLWRAPHLLLEKPEKILRIIVPNGPGNLIQKLQIIIQHILANGINYV